MEKKSAKGVKSYGLVVMYSQENVMVVVMRVIRLEKWLEFERKLDKRLSKFTTTQLNLRLDRIIIILRNGDF